MAGVGSHGGSSVAVSHLYEYCKIRHVGAILSAVKNNSTNRCKDKPIQTEEDEGHNLGHHDGSIEAMKMNMSVGLRIEIPTE